MLCLKDELFVKVFQHIVVVLLTHCCGGQSLVGGPPPPVAALVGEDILLPCRLDPAADAVSMIIEWGRPNLKPRFVHVWHEGQDLLVNQNPSYKGRTSLSTDKLKHGDLSLRLSKVKVPDGGTYRCFIPKLSRESTVQLIVGSVSSPVITGINISSNAGVLQCESKGWYPEPEVVWLDGEGNLLSAGPTETVRGPDDLYTVSSRVTVEKRHSNNFTCRVQQKDINQTRETHIQITADPCNTSLHCCIIIGVDSVVYAVCSFGTVVVFVMWKKKQEKKRKREEVAWLEEELDEVNIIIATSEEVKKEEKKQRKLIKLQLKEVERDIKESKSKIESVEVSITNSEKERAVNRADEYLREKTTLIETKKKLEERKETLDTQQMIIDKILQDIEEMNSKLKQRQARTKARLRDLRPFNS